MSGIKRWFSGRGRNKDYVGERMGGNDDSAPRDRQRRDDDYDEFASAGRHDTN